jgi:hypothetical protein
MFWMRVADSTELEVSVSVRTNANIDRISAHSYIPPKGDKQSEIEVRPLRRARHRAQRRNSKAAQYVPLPEEAEGDDGVAGALDLPEEEGGEADGEADDERCDLLRLLPFRLYAAAECEREQGEREGGGKKQEAGYVRFPEQVAPAGRGAHHCANAGYAGEQPPPPRPPLALPERQQQRDRQNRHGDCAEAETP